LSIFLVLIPKLQHALLLPNCYIIESIKGLGGVSPDDALSNSLTNSTSPKVKMVEEKKVGVHSLACCTSRVRRACWSFEMGIKTNDKRVNYSHGQCKHKSLLKRNYNIILTTQNTTSRTLQGSCHKKYTNLCNEKKRNKPSTPRYLTTRPNHK
jgi:hypothetical protein